MLTTTATTTTTAAAKNKFFFVFVVTLSPIISHVSSSSVLGYIMTPNICSFAVGKKKQEI
jgi:hypothetical protein